MRKKHKKIFDAKQVWSPQLTGKYAETIANTLTDGKEDAN
jgi:hypothetical protein